jgi:hypothetical protein
MTRSHSRSIIALRLVISLLFAPAILDKLIDPDEYGRLFTTWGYPPWGPLVISIIEIMDSWRYGFQHSRHRPLLL